jgi:hypothetical protein
MKTNCINRSNLSSLIIIPVLLYSINLSAQPRLSVYTDLGSNNVSSGMFIKSAAIGLYKNGKNNFETGFQTNLKNNLKTGFSGYRISASRNMALKDIAFELNGFFMQTLPSEILTETNWGALIQMSHNRFEMTIGTNFRTYSLRQKTVIGYESGSTRNKIHEVYNLIYSFCYYLKPADEKWNMGLSVTNIDYFSINQETNPVLNLKSMYKISSPVTINVQASYKSAGVTNLELNYFGFFFRTGIVWNIN